MHLFSMCGSQMKFNGLVQIDLTLPTFYFLTVQEAETSEYF